VLDLLDFSQLTNDPISHNLSWLVIPTKIPSEIPKFNGSLGEELSTHIMTYHLWCSSNSLIDDSVTMFVFQRSMSGASAKWYIELKGISFKRFNDLAMEFLTHYKLPILLEK
jgi:hypothetical protein